MLPDLSGLSAYDEELALDMLEGDQELLRELLGFFRSQGVETLTELREEIDRGRHEEVTRLAHSLKGSAGNVCALRLRVLAEALEEAADRQDVSCFEEFYEGIYEEFDEFRRSTELTL